MEFKKATDQQTKETPTNSDVSSLTGSIMDSSLFELKVLITDDSFVNTKLLKRKFANPPFKALRWTIDVAASGEEAMEKLEEADFSLIILDEHMDEGEGKLTGSETTRLIREGEKRNQKCVIIGCSGNCTEADKVESKKVGQDSFWNKPLPTDDMILKELEAIFEERGARRRVGV